jgi:hypothetical protein
MNNVTDEPFFSFDMAQGAILIFDQTPPAEVAKMYDYMLENNQAPLKVIEDVAHPLCQHILANSDDPTSFEKHFKCLIVHIQYHKIYKA